MNPLLLLIVSIHFHFGLSVVKHKKHLCKIKGALLKKVLQELGFGVEKFKMLNMVPYIVFNNF
jgi:hypothetical protein